MVGPTGAHIGLNGEPLSLSNPSSLSSSSSSSSSSIQKECNEVTSTSCIGDGGITNPAGGCRGCGFDDNINTVNVGIMWTPEKKDIHEKEGEKKNGMKEEEVCLFF